MPILRRCYPICLLLLVSTWAQPCAARATEQKPVRNVIIMISDGMGYGHREAASLYASGQPHSQVYASFPVQLAMSTYPLEGSYDSELAWRTFDYVKQGATDSAAAATAMACGHKTRRGIIGMVPAADGHLQAMENLVERAEKLGKASGVVTSVPFAHATPAGFSVHDPDRKNHAALANRMLRDSALDVIMGCGHPFFDRNGDQLNTSRSFKAVGGEETWAALRAGTLGGDADGDGQADPWTLVERRRDFQELAGGAAPRRLLGIAQVARTLQYDRDGDRQDRPYAVPLIKTVPTLGEMTSAALNVLDDDPDGFLLMIEGGAVDWAGHDNHAGRLLEEQLDFDRAVATVVHWVESFSSWEETLLVVTADHETGYLTGPGSDPAWRPLVNRGRNRMPEVEWHSDYHTNSLVPLFAKGRGASLLSSLVRGRDARRGAYVDNTAVAEMVWSDMQ